MLPFEKNQKLYYHKPDIIDERNGSYLLVWGDLAQWMVVDRECFELLTRIDQLQTIHKVIEEYSGKDKKKQKEQEENILSIMRELKARSILADKPLKILSEIDQIKYANITYNITNQCNLSCAFCYNKNRQNQEIPLNLLFKNLKSAEQYIDENASFIILGGEPFLHHKKLIKTIREANRVFQKPVLVSTNGTLVTDKIAGQLKKLNVEVQVSLDSPHESIHDKNRGKGVYQKAIEAIQILLAHQIYTIVSMVYTKENYLQMEAFLELALKSGVNEARFIPLRLIGKGTDLKHLKPDQFIIYENLLNILQNHPEYMPLVKRDYFSIQKEICQYSQVRDNCGISNKSLFLDADGLVYPCPNTCNEDHNLGNLDRQSLKEIIETSPVIKHIKKTYQLANYHQCRSCAFRYWCAGDCRGEVISCTNDPFAPSRHCSELKKLFQEIFRQLSGQFS